METLTPMETRKFGTASAVLHREEGSSEKYEGPKEQRLGEFTISALVDTVAGRSPVSVQTMVSQP